VTALVNVGVVLGLAWGLLARMMYVRLVHLLDGGKRKERRGFGGDRPYGA
jgi:hypothetical protein